MIAILEYGMGNVGSIVNMLKKVGVAAGTITTAYEIEGAQSLIIPGVGHIDNAIERLESAGLRDALDDAAMRRCIPILGLGWVPATATRFDGETLGLRVPHMGWNVVNLRKPNLCFDGDGFDERRFYFVHSYAVHCEDPADVLTSTTYGIEFVSAFQRKNLTGVQFHPEKSHKFGESFFRRYLAGNNGQPLNAAS